MRFKSKQFMQLREKAEKLCAPSKPKQSDEMQRILQELDVRQTELEIQNEELRRTQAELEESTQKYSNLYDFAPIGYLSLNKAGIILGANLTATTMLGLNRYALLSWPFVSFVRESRKAEFRRYLRECFETRSKQYRETEIVTHQGKHVQMQLETIACENLGTGQTECRTALIDISDRKEMENQLKAARNRTEKLIKSNLIGIIIEDPSGNVIEANTAFLTLSGFSEEELKAKKIHFPFFTFGPKGSTLTEETLLTRSDGAQIPVLVGCTPLEDGSVIKFVLDITCLKNAQYKLIEEKKNIEKVNLELDNFVYIASHDLRGPLRNIGCFADMLLREYKERLPAPGKGWLERIAGAARKLDSLIQDLLTLSRISRINNPYVTVESNELVRQALDRMESEVQEKKAEIKIQRELPRIVCDPIKMKEVFVNLISNALKYSGDKKLPVIEIGYRKVENDHEFRIEDNGIGIDPSYHEQIFGLFRRLHTDREFEGTGAGLYIVKRILEGHGGSIRVESQAHSGSKFYFRIPDKKAGQERFRPNHR